MAITKNELITTVRRRLGEPMVKVEVCDDQIRDNIEYARKKYIKWAIGNATQEVYFTLRLEAGKRFYDLPAGVVSVVSYDDQQSSYGGINTLFTVENYMYNKGALSYFDQPFNMVDYHLTLDFLDTLNRYVHTKYNYKYHQKSNQIEVNPVPEPGNRSIVQRVDSFTGKTRDVVIDSPGWVLIRSYMIEGSTVPSSNPRDWENVIRETKDIKEQRILTQEEVESATLALDHYPSIESSEVKLYVNDNLKRYGIDYVLNEDNRRILMWSGFSLNAQAGDEVVIEYPIVFKSIYYHDSWTIVDTDMISERKKLTQTQVSQSKIYLSKKIYNDNVIVFINDEPKVKGVDWEVGYDDRTITWKDKTLDGVLTTDDVIEVKYVIVTKVDSSDSSEKDKMSFNLEYKDNIENRTLTSTEISNKSFQLEKPAITKYNIELYVKGDKKELGIDYRVLPDIQTISWSGYDLENVSLSGGDSVVLKYTLNETEMVDVEEEIYDNDWFIDYIAALTKINLGYIRRKFSGFQSLGNTGIEMDGDSLISEGKEEKTELEETLRNEEAYEGLGIVIG